MSRTINHYFNVLGSKGEQRLVEDLVIEAIRINGMQIHYVPRTLVKLDPVFGEDPMSKFEKTFPIEAYFDDPAAGFTGNRSIITKLGMQMQDDANFIISRRRFNEAVRYNGFGALPKTHFTDKEERPQEGDLIYLPLTNDIFQIAYAEHESVFYQVGYRYIWRVSVNKFRYSSEKLQTGIKGLDRAQTVFENIDSTENDPIAINTELRNEGTNILDFSEENPFGEPDHN